MGRIAQRFVFTPHAEFPERGQTELGYQFTYYTIKAKQMTKGFISTTAFQKTCALELSFTKMVTPKRCIIILHIAWGRFFQIRDTTLFFLAVLIIWA